MKKAITDIIPLEKFKDAEHYSFIKLLGNGITRIISPKFVVNVELMDQDQHVVKVTQTDSEIIFNIDDIDTVQIGNIFDMSKAVLTDSQRCIIDMLMSKQNELLNIYFDKINEPTIINPSESDITFMDAGSAAIAVRIKTPEHGYFFALGDINRLTEDYL